MVQQDVAFPDDAEQIGTCFQLLGDAGDERGKLERGIVDQIGNLHQAHQVHGPVDAVQVVCGKLELLQEKLDRKSTRLNSSHSQISYAVFCLKKKKKNCDLDDVILDSTQKLMPDLASFHLTLLLRATALSVP